MTDDPRNRRGTTSGTKEVGPRREQRPRAAAVADATWPVLDKRRLRASFERAADTYDGSAVLQRTIADRLIERLDVVKLQPGVVLDVGCGTGYVSRALARRYPRAQRLALDIAEPMLHRACQGLGWRGLFVRSPRPVCGDAESLPLASASVDMIVSSLALQWCDAAAAIAEFHRVLRPGGMLMFSTFGPDTLVELRQAWRAVDARTHVHSFLDMHDLGDLLVRTGFAEPVMDLERFTLTYPSVLGVLRDIKHLGAHNAARERDRGLTGKQRFARFRAAYETQARDGRIPATYETVYGLAWMPEIARTPRATDGTVSVPLTEIRRPHRGEEAR